MVLFRALNDEETSNDCLRNDDQERLNKYFKSNSIYFPDVSTSMSHLQCYK